MYENTHRNFVTTANVFLLNMLLFDFESIFKFIITPYITTEVYKLVCMTRIQETVMKIFYRLKTYSEVSIRDLLFIKGVK